MSNPSPITREIGLREERMLKAKRNRMRSIWQGFGFFGLIGWSIVVPTLIGAAAGRWLDSAQPEERSWTLALLIAGLMVGCFNAGHWIFKEQCSINSEQESNNE
ncbi:MAG: AtpZ/AtpI family protein [Roseibacillus sp.]